MKEPCKNDKNGMLSKINKAAKEQWQKGQETYREALKRVSRQIYANTAGK